jgi:hypothetical protein
VIQESIFPIGHELNTNTARKLFLEEKASIAQQLDKKPGRPVNDLTGQRNGKLLVVSPVDDNSTSAQVFLCHCDCGSQVFVTGRHWANGLSHCGCEGVGRGKTSRPGTLGYRGAVGKSLERSTRSNRNEAAAHNLFLQYQHSAVSRGYIWDLQEEVFMEMTSQPCHYCNSQPEQLHRFRGGVYAYNGIDRMDSGLGYTEANVVTACGICNRAKQTMSYDDFWKWIERVAKCKGG